MTTKITFLNASGVLETKVLNPIIAHAKVEWDEVHSDYIFTNDESGYSHLLHSENDEPCYTEGIDEGVELRRHWMYKGRLHRVTGPAFTQGDNSEYYVFGQPVSLEFLIEHKKYLQTLDKFARENHIDMHGGSDGLSNFKYYIHFSDQYHLEDFAQRNQVTIVNRETGVSSVLSMDVLLKEVGTESTTTKSHSGIMMAAALGVAAAFGATKLRKTVKVEQKKEEQVFVK